MSEVISEEEFIDLYVTIGATALSKRLGINPRSVNQRRARIEQRRGMVIKGPTKYGVQRQAPRETIRRNIEVTDGYVIVGSDAHYWPNDISTAHRAFCDLCEDLNPKVVILNGDMFDGARLSRHPPLGWENLPEPHEELEVCQERLEEIRAASPKAKHYWTLGNHDARFETRLATALPQMEGIQGMHLKDHFPDWIPSMSVWINDDVVVKHNWKGGVHAAHNNAKMSGKTMVTGHTHQQQVSSWTNYNGTVYGIEAGTMAEAYGEQFMYANDNPRNWVSGFVVLSFAKDGRLRYPEVVRVLSEGVYEFRGEERTVG